MNRLVQCLHSQYIRVLFIPTLLALAIWLLSVSVPAFNSVAPLAFSEGFPGDKGAWRIEPLDAHVEFNRSDKFDQGILVESHPDKRQRITHSTFLANLVGKQVQLTATVEVERQRNPKPVIASLAMWFQDSAGEYLGYKNVFFMPNRYRQAKVSHVSLVTEDYRELVIGLISGLGAETFRVHSLQLNIVTPNVRYQWLLYCLIASWIIYSLFLTRWILQWVNPLLLVALILGVLLMLLGVASSTDSMTQYVRPVFKALIPDWAGVAGFRHSMQLGHFTGFLVLSVCALSISRRSGNSDLPIVLLLIVLATATEFVQLHVPGRQASLLDLFIDAAGIIVGWTVLTALSRKRLKL